MYRDDQEALLERADSATREAEQLRRENAAMRKAVAGQSSHTVTTLTMPPSAVYSALDLRLLPLEERARLAAHDLRAFPVWLVGILNVLTLGLFPLIHFGLMHDRLPRAASNDPSAGKAIGFQFIPYYNLYWVFFSALRLCDRITLQYRLRGLSRGAPRGLVLAACVLTVIPYVNIFIGLPIVWTIAVCLLQMSVNEAAAFRHDDWDATQLEGATSAPVAFIPAPTAEQLVTMQKAQKLVTWSHILGWGGLAMLLIGSMAAAVLGGPKAAATVAGISMVSVVVGAIVGQIGRGMQGRAI
jgi:hypothetical protein